MKKIIVVLSLLLGLKLNAQTKTFTVYGKIKGLDTKEMSIVIDDKTTANGYRRDKIPVTDESFSYTATINEASFITIWPGVESTVKKVKSGGYYPAKSSLLLCIASPGVKIKFSGSITDFVNAYPSGDKTNEEIARLNKSINPILNKSVNVQVKITDSIVSDPIEVKNLQDSMKIWDDKVVKMKKQFIKSSAASIAAIWLLSDMMIRSQITNEEAISFFKLMNKEKLVGVSYYKEVAKRVDGISATGIGKPVPEINSWNTFDGKKFDLASLKGKYVVLDFWGTWCGPCIAGMPKMREYREKYKDKIEIVGIAQESDNGEKWKKFLEEKPQFQWPHVLSKKNSEDYILKFNVAGFPTKIIVDPLGVIISRFVGEDEEIYKKLDEILK